MGRRIPLQPGLRPKGLRHRLRIQIKLLQHRRRRSSPLYLLLNFLQIPLQILLQILLPFLRLLPKDLLQALLNLREGWNFLYFAALISGWLVCA